MLTSNLSPGKVEKYGGGPPFRPSLSESVTVPWNVSVTYWADAVSQVSPIIPAAISFVLIGVLCYMLFTRVFLLLGLLPP